MRRVSIKAVALGGFADIVSSIAFDIPVSLWVLSRVNFLHVAPEQIQASVSAAVSAHPGVHTLEMLLGFVASILGGYVAARLAKHDALLNGALSSWLCVALGIGGMALGVDSDPVRTQVLLVVVSPAFGLLGGYLASLRKQPVAQPV